MNSESFQQSSQLKLYRDILNLDIRHLAYLLQQHGQELLTKAPEMKTYFGWDGFEVDSQL